MPDTFNPDYNWLKTWKENTSPPTIFYGSTPGLVPEIKKAGLVPFNEGDGLFMGGVQDALSMAKKLRDGRCIEFAEILLLEHSERPRPLQLTFNYYLALQQLERRARKLKALQWLYELLFEQLKKNAPFRPTETEIKKLNKNAEELNSVQSDNRGVIVYLGTDLKKCDTLPPIMKDKKELRRAIKGKNPLCSICGPKDKKWRKLSKDELETCIETMVRGSEDFEGLGSEITTSETIPPSDILELKYVQLQ
ncbi:MAG: hypothetical protein NOU37_02715 [Candidatus Brocadiales bacterium]|nr:hypothetical protein [Candidatus Bathyanammoxibius amoris]